ncbi:hypothetical protein TELCIR_09625 [Teladorsagia circumcincta]|uniref:Uncharacterized protein n=1 Tax=Teladorsagia circumcincta TaxID=45464 RepID=A0A2G9UGF8_TELCI|nr:hypothetical protein TELCIR_09625 [Teladorsagia circumcincta]
MMGGVSPGTSGLTQPILNEWNTRLPRVTYDPGFDPNRGINVFCHYTTSTFFASNTTNKMWSAWLIVIYTITCLLVIGIIAIGVWFVRVDMQRSKMISARKGAAATSHKYGVTNYSYTYCGEALLRGGQKPTIKQPLCSTTQVDSRSLT